MRYYTDIELSYGRYCRSQGANEHLPNASFTDYHMVVGPKTDVVASAVLQRIIEEHDLSEEAVALLF